MHAFIEPVGIPCSDINDDQFKSAPAGPVAAAPARKQKFIMLQLSSPWAEASISIHPNPNDGLFTLDLSSNEATQGDLLIRNGLGALVKTTAVKTGPNTIDLRGQPPGVYFLSIQLLDGSIFNRKLVLQ